MFILSSVLFTYNLASSQLEKPEDPISALHHGFMLLQGIKVVLEPHWDHIKDDPIISRTINTTSLGKLQASDTLTKEDGPQEILHLNELMGMLPDCADKMACTTAIDELHGIWMRMQRLSSDQDEYALLFEWPAQVSTRFMNLLAAHTPVTCIITGHFAAMMAQCRPVWWAHKWPRWFLGALEHLLTTTPDLLKWLAWPQQIIYAQNSSVIATPNAT
jgi:hypothetical protein